MFTDTYYVVVGSYSTTDPDGIHVLVFDKKEGHLEKINGISGIENPSFLAFDREYNRLYAVSEKRVNAEIISFEFDNNNGALSIMNRQKTMGSHPCHLSVENTGKWLLSVNYSSGNVCSYPLTSTGTIRSMADFIQHTGSSINKDRQKSPHPHSISNIPGTYYWMVPDLGTDRIYVYELDQTNGKLNLADEQPTEKGVGPRHVTFHPFDSIVYVIQELSSTVASFSFDRISGKLTRIQKDVSTLPSTYSGQNTCSDIHVHPSGHYLYGSNRGHDSLVTFKINSDRTLEQIAHTPTMGRTPRNFGLVPDSPYILVANQDSNSIVVMKDSVNGIPITTGQKYNIHHPSCIKVFPKRA